MAKILVIDDSEDLCSVLSAQLSRAHHSTETAENGEEGLSRCEREPFDLVLLDIWMPKVDGITALKILRERWPNLPVIVMSGGLEPDTFGILGRTGRSPWRHGGTL